MPPRAEIVISPEEWSLLSSMAQLDCGRSPQARRAQIILHLADGRTPQEVQACVGCSTQTVRAWRRRFLMRGMQALRPRPPRMTRRAALLAAATDEAAGW